ncbi:hypothetical protein NQ318_001715 [Aromia moschata]|uniref:Secreted protein n=1 Tax=Aromia moschata TaxID=1265417 RepID=A0AAV8XWW8_9CUCU|nr:hypothetical protein NQ318_001715 [Aromia moschata]
MTRVCFVYIMIVVENVCPTVSGLKFNFTKPDALADADANLVGETRVEKSVVFRCFVENVQFFVSTPKVPVPTPESDHWLAVSLDWTGVVRGGIPSRRLESQAFACPSYKEH